MGTVHELVSGERYRFADWPVDAVPLAAAGVYTVWDGDELLYVGMSGRGSSAAKLETARRAGKRVALCTRLDSHASGRRSGDQFCVYVCDRLVLPGLSKFDVEQVAAAELSLDKMTRAYVRDRLSFRFVTLPDGRSALELERLARGGEFGPSPTFNPSKPPDG